MLVAELHRTGMTRSKQMTRALLEKYEEQISALIETGKMFGEIHPHVATASAATLFIGTIQGLITHYSFVDSPAKLQTEAAAVFDLYRRGIQYNQ